MPGTHHRAGTDAQHRGRTDSSTLRSPRVHGLYGGHDLGPETSYIDTYALAEAISLKVKAAVARAHGAPLVVEGLDLDEPRADEILVRLIASGVSQADLAAIEGRVPMPLPFVPGAAGAGIVERVGDAVVGVAPGDAVIVDFAACGLCEACAAGDPRRCIGFAALNLGGRRLDGSAPFSAASEPVNGFFFGQSSFSTHLICAATSATTLPAGAALEVLAGLPGEMLVGAGAVDGALGLRRGDTLVITGADAAGLAATMMAKARGAGMIIVADPRERRRDLATALGATVAVHTDDDLAAVVRSLTGDGVRFALETIGHAAARQACLDSLAPGGTCAIVDLLAGELVADEISAGDTRVVAAHGHADPRGLLAELAALHASGDLPLDTLVDFFPFEHANDALDALRAERVVKPVIRFPVGSFGDLDRALSEGAAQDVPETAESTSDDRVPAEAPAQDDGDGERQPAVPA